MPGIKGHENQIAINRQLLRDFNTGKLTANFYDWRVTVAFYIAVHLVERVLYKECKVNSSNHTDRKNFIKSNPCLREIRSDYQQLYQMSRKARYECSSISSSEYKDAIQLMNEIEKKLS